MNAAILIFEPLLMCFWHVALKAMSVIGDRRSREQKAKQERWPCLMSDYYHLVYDCVVNKWSRQYSLWSIPQRKGTSQSNNQEGRCGTHCEYAKVYFHARFLNTLNMLRSCWQMGEMEISRAVAERSLREHMGNVVEALIALTNWVDVTALRCIGLPSSRFWWPCSFHTVLIL